MRSHLKSRESLASAKNVQERHLVGCIRDKLVVIDCDALALPTERAAAYHKRKRKQGDGDYARRYVDEFLHEVPPEPKRLYQT
jgi:hypothetical protein